MILLRWSLVIKRSTAQQNTTSPLNTCCHHQRPKRSACDLEHNPDQQNATSGAAHTPPRNQALILPPRQVPRVPGKGQQLPRVSGRAQLHGLRLSNCTLQAQSFARHGLGRCMRAGLLTMIPSTILEGKSFIGARDDGLCSKQ